MKCWRIEVLTKDGMPDPIGDAAARSLRAAGLEVSRVRSVRGYLCDPSLGREAIEALCREVLVDPIADRCEILTPEELPESAPNRLTIQPRPGVTDPVAQTMQEALALCDLPQVTTGTYRGFLVESGHSPQELQDAAGQGLANEVIEQVLTGTPPIGLPGPGGQPDLAVRDVPLDGLDDAGLEKISVEGGLALTVREMRTIQSHYGDAGRAPTQIELETIAQTWSEHCKHKTLTGQIRFGDEVIDNLLTSEIARVTNELDRDFCVSVFVDNAGVITFDDDDCVCIKVETHNHPSAIEPFGGSATGVGGVIRDILGTGLGAWPVASTDVFCLAPPDTKEEDVPKGCLHPERVLRGVVQGVRDYGNPMGIPTVQGAVHFDPDFVGNPLVYVGNIGILPKDKVQKQPKPGDRIITVGGRTGRDGIHGATFSSLALHTESETVSSGAVQIGDPITERKVMELVVRARDEGLFHAITDCGAGGFSSAVGEMAEGLGARVQLDKAPLKYAGLAPWEIWISEAQERMVLSVPEANLPRLAELCAEENVEWADLGSFDDTGRLVLEYDGTLHGDLDLHFMHEGLPVFEREARYTEPDLSDPNLPEWSGTQLADALHQTLRDPNVASKEWIIRQYDHEVQAAAATKPLIGPERLGPGDGSVLAPKLGSNRGVVLSSGLNPRYSRIDPAAMAECALDEAMRNIVAQGGDPEHTAILDNYSWGNCEDPEQLGGLVRATRSLCSLAKTYRTPFISGKDSLNNTFHDGDRKISIPGCLLVTAMSVIPDVRRTIDASPKTDDGYLCLVGLTKDELGGSVYWKTRGELGRSVPRVDQEMGKKVLDRMARAIAAESVTACHDLSEGGLAVACAEFAISSRKGLDIDLAEAPRNAELSAERILFSESQSRFLCEVPADRLQDFEANLGEVPFGILGRIRSDQQVLAVHNGTETLFTAPIDELTTSFRSTLDLDNTLEGQSR
ncbi:MAG: phosphoribosylformylglycinamidine synthase subunit PurL [Planctomycetota bacterium]